MTAAAAPLVQLRGTLPGDLPSLFQFQLDPVANQIAGTKPRDLEAFRSRWEEIFRDPAVAGVTPRIVIADGTLAGSINIVKEDGDDCIGYWIAREHWGRGIATRAIALMIGEVAIRPLTAQVAAHNTASLRALQRNGFVVTSRSHTPATQRRVARETIVLKLR